MSITQIVILIVVGLVGMTALLLIAPSVGKPRKATYALIGMACAGYISYILSSNLG